MENKFFSLVHFHYFSRTIKAFVKLITHKKYSDWDLSDNLYLFVEIMIEKVFFVAKNFLIKGRRKILTFEDLTNSLNIIIDPDFFKNCLSFYRKQKKDYNFIGQIRSNRKKKQNLFCGSFSFVSQSWSQSYLCQNTLKKKRLFSRKNKKLNRIVFRRKYFSIENFSTSILSKNHTRFFKIFVTLFERGNKCQQDVCFASLSEDQGLAPLFPYLILYLNQIFFSKNPNIKKLKLGLKTIFALSLNDFYKLQPFLGQIFPFLTQCLFTEFFKENEKEIIYLKYLSSKIISFIFSKDNQNNLGFKSRLVFILTENITSPLKNFGKIFGALIGLSLLGVKITELHTIPALYIVLEKLKIEIFSKKPAKSELILYERFLDLSLTTISSYLIQKNLQIAFERNFYVFGESNIEKTYKIIPLLERIKKDINRL